MDKDKITGCAFLLILGCIILVQGFMNAPYGEFYECIGFISGGIFLSSICFYFGIKQLKTGGNKNGNK